MWNEIKSQEDIDLFMKQVLSFHDSCIRETRYISGTYIDKDGAMVMNTNPFMYIKFDTQRSSNFTWFEFELGGIDNFSIKINLNSTLDIYSATFFKKNDWFYWYSDEYADENSEYMFRCQTIRWRMVPYSKQVSVG